MEGIVFRETFHFVTVVRASESEGGLDQGTLRFLVLEEAQLKLISPSVCNCQT